MKANDRQRRRGGLVLVEALESRVMMTTVPAYNFTSVADFVYKTTGANPQALVMDSQGNLYGVTSGGGSKHYGTVFEVVAGSTTIIKLAEFTGANGIGISPRGNLVLEGGNLYGITVGGGTSNKGTIFKVTLAGTQSTLSTVASFDGTNGAYPFAGLVVDGAGTLYGETVGAKDRKGYASTVWKLDLTVQSPAISTLATFKATDQLNSTLVVDSAGNVFGTTAFGGTAKRGSVFEIVAGSGTGTTLASFKGTNSGYQPRGTLVVGTDSSLIGITGAGGTKGYGTVFKVTVAGTNSTLTTLVNFTESSGHRPTGSLVVDSAGTLFGVTAVGGKYDAGTVYGVANIFSLSAGAGTVTTLATFRNKSTGAYPTGTLLLATDGTLWGTTDLGGKDNSGNVFKLTPVVAQEQ